MLIAWFIGGIILLTLMMLYFWRHRAEYLRQRAKIFALAREERKGKIEQSSEF